MMRNALTIDVEDYFQVSAFSPYIPRSEWEALPCRVERNVDRILALLDENDIKATFFTLGWIAERYPAMVQQIVANGHELASHGYAHHRVTEMNPAQFRDDIIRSKQLLEDIGGLPIAGYRAPSFSIGSHNLWALDCLEEAGYRYSSSIYPVRHDHYGMPDAPRFAFHPNPSGKLLELPVTTVRMFGRNLPSGGGGYFRLWPYAVSRWFLQRVNMVDRQPVIFYFHPWEIDPDQPRQQAINFKTRFRHYLNLSRMEKRLAALTRHFHWGRMDQVFLKQLT
ncbi:MAG TPA: DUF3473 domain-containing protein [Nitrosomonas halophila]|nr:DUF3473 domain-containing protein [Nitrosomonas halophila]